MQIYICDTCGRPHEGFTVCPYCGDRYYSVARPIEEIEQEGGDLCEITANADKAKRKELTKWRVYMK